MKRIQDNQRRRRCRSILTVLATGLLGLSIVNAAQDLDELRITVLKGEDSVNIIAQGTAVPTLVEVRDRNNLPVAGASVVFLLQGTTATLNAGLSQVALTTNALGQAAVTVNPLTSGAVNLTVNAAFQGQTATAAIVQTNFATAAQAAAAGAGTTGGTGGGGGTAAAGGAGGGAGGGLGAGAIIGIVGAGVGAAVGVAVATTQEEPCTFSVSFAPGDFSAVHGDGATVYVDVRAEPVDCSSSEWTATSDSAFISVSPGSGFGDGSVTVTIGQNGPDDRSGTVTIAGRAIDVVQAEAAAPCDEQVIPGGNTPETHRIGLGRTSGRFVFNYQTYSQEDRMIVRYEGRMLFDTSCVGAQGSRTLSFSGRSSVVEVEVIPNCAGGSGTAWDFQVACATP